jgi:hypothetical protein
MLFANEWAKQNGSYLVEISLTAENSEGVEESVIPTSVVWSLMDKDGNIINSRDEVAVGGTLTASTLIRLGSSDLVIQDSETNRDTVLRHLVVQVTYDSDSTVGVPLTEMLTFILQNLYLD